MTLSLKKTPGRPKSSCAHAGGRAGHRPDLGGALKHWRATPAATALVALALAALLTATAHAGPGAHGPNGEHLDAPVAARPATALPRVQAHTDAFELVAELRATELTILVDRYESNEPVLGAKLEVESGAFKATASFRAEQGDYVVTDAALLKALNAPGEHALVFTLVAGTTSDLLDGTLTTPSKNATAATSHTIHASHDHAEGDHHHHDWERAAWVGAGILALSLVGGVGWWRQRRQPTRLQQGGQ